MREEIVETILARLGGGPAAQASSSSATASSSAASSSSSGPTSAGVLPMGHASAVPAAKVAQKRVSKIILQLEAHGIEATQLREANDKLEPPLSSERCAQAYTPLHA